MRVLFILSYIINYTTILNETQKPALSYILVKIQKGLPAVCLNTDS